MEPMEPLDPQLRRLVHDGMVQAVPSAAVQERVLHGLLARLQEPAPPEPEPDGDGDGGPEVAPAEPVTIAASGAKTLLAVALGGAAIVGLAWAVVGGREPPRERPTTVAVEAPSKGRSTASASEAAASPEAVPSDASGQHEAPPSGGSIATPGPSTVEPSSTRERPSAPTRAAASPSSRAEPTTPPAERVDPIDAPADALEAEVRLVAAAERALAAEDPRQALALAREHARAHPHGQLEIERTAIELSARCALAEPGAPAAAAAFLRAHARAPAAAKVRARCSAEPDNQPAPEKKSTAP